LNTFEHFHTLQIYQFIAISSGFTPRERRAIVSRARHYANSPETNPSNPPRAIPLSALNASPAGMEQTKR
jgi:hypothetical protein